MIADQTNLLLTRGSGGVRSNASFTDFKCDSFTGWLNQDNGEGASTLDTFEGSPVFKMDGGATYDPNNVAGVSKTLSAGAEKERKVLTYVVNLADEGKISDGVFNALNLNLYLGPDLGFCPLVVFADGIQSYDGGYYTIVSGLNLANANHKLTVDITYVGIVGTFSLYIGDTLIDTGLPITLVASGDLGRVDMAQYSRVNGAPYVPKVSYIGEILIGDNFA